MSHENSGFLFPTRVVPNTSAPSSAKVPENPLVTIESGKRTDAGPRAGPVGLALPCSQFLTVLTGTPIASANVRCVAPMPFEAGAANQPPRLRGVGAIYFSFICFDCFQKAEA